MYGQLTLLEEKGHLWRCRCACGAEKWLSKRSVKYGDVKSCGCLARKPRPVSTGSVFGNLTVLEFLDKDCRCRCACGRELMVASKSLKSGNTKSCGCLKHSVGKKRSLNLVPAGSRFGRLTVLENKVGVCHCSCDHGGVGSPSDFLTLTSSLRSGKTQSCGCLRKEKTAQINKAEQLRLGDVFGRLTVLEDRGKHCFCRCACGREVLVLSTRLRSKHTQSCGCLQREKAGLSQIKLAEAGERFGRLEVVRCVRKSGRGTWCDCKCDCGAQVTVRLSKLRFGHTQSCGCLTDEHCLEMAEHRKMGSGVAAFRSLYSLYRTQAGHRKLAFDLSREDFRRIIGEKCRYCGVDPEQIKRTGGGAYSYNGIDRVDNSRGYVLDNVAACCLFCNRMKADQTELEFLEWVRGASVRLKEPIVFESHPAPKKVLDRFNTYVKSARTRGYKFTLSQAQFTVLSTGACHYCKQPPPCDSIHGIDRKDNRVGYTEENAVSCCRRCNMAKGTADLLKYRTWLERVVKAVT